MGRIAGVGVFFCVLAGCAAVLALGGCAGAEDPARPGSDLAAFTPQNPTTTVPGNTPPNTSAPPPGETGGAQAGAPGNPLPCDVGPLVANRCHQCHGPTPIGGAPMSLVTHEDFHRAAFSDPTRAVYELVSARINDSARPMPPGRQMVEPDLAVFNTWLSAGAPAGVSGQACSASEMPPAPGDDGAAGMGGMTTVDPEPEDEWTPPAENETCYEFPNHGGQTEGDTSKYTVAPGENYEQFYFAVPWDEDARATRFGSRFDNVQVLHHWLLYTSSKPVSRSGTHETVIGTVLDDPGATLIAGWAVGGQENLIYPEEVEGELPPPGTLLNAQWHLWNNTATPQQDGSAVVVCTVPAGTRPNTGSITWLGTENFFGPAGMPPGYRGDFSGTCLNDSGGPITIFNVTPHMHQIGRHMRATVRRADGSTEVVFDEPFDFNFQINYEVDIVLQPGDAITATCTFENVQDFNVPFGPSSEQEMCYLFANSYPAGALDNGIFSLAGATNTCW